MTFAKEMKSLLTALILFAAPLVYAAEVTSAQLDAIVERVEIIELKQSSLDQGLANDTQKLERRMDQLEDNATAGIGLFVSGFLCALWAQYTRRLAWLWFFFGLFLAPIALIAMVWKNALGLASGELRFWTRD